MQIREGAYYRTRGGDVVGPMKKTDDCMQYDYPWSSLYECWTDEGVFNIADGECEADLISEVYVSDTPPVVKETEAELREMMRDPRYWQKREPEWVKRVTDGFRALVGGSVPPADAPTPPPAMLKPQEWRRIKPIEPSPETKTLRDEFAMAALKAMLGHSDYVELSPDQMAVEAYRQANAMMEARKK